MALSIELKYRTAPFRPAPEPFYCDDESDLSPFPPENEPGTSPHRKPKIVDGLPFRPIVIAI
jgi:hypothetical protein